MTEQAQQSVAKEVLLQGFAATPIEFSYSHATPNVIKELQQLNGIREIAPQANMRVLNAYYKANYPGALARVYTRESVYNRLLRLADLLAPTAGIEIFDAFRTLKTQQHLFHLLSQEIKLAHSEWDAARVEEEVLKFVSHPSDPSHFALPLHNSGGAIDLTIYDQASGRLWDMGTGIDTANELSFSDYFERDYDPNINSNINETRWYTVRQNRRILFNAMCYLGFVNFANEWWHYDLGDCNWAEQKKTPWFYPSMEKIVIAHHKKV